MEGRGDWVEWEREGDRKGGMFFFLPNLAHFNDNIKSRF